MGFFYTSFPSTDIESTRASKKGNSDGTMGSKSKIEHMKSYRINKKEAEQKLKNQKRENALDIISKSVFKCLLEGFGWDISVNNLNF